MLVLHLKKYLFLLVIETFVYLSKKYGGIPNIFRDSDLNSDSPVYFAGRNVRQSAILSIQKDGEKYIYFSISLVEGKITSKEYIMKRADERNDDWGRGVKCWITFPVTDLPAADARYHKDCHVKFFCNQHSPLHSYQIVHLKHWLNKCFSKGRWGAQNTSGDIC